MGPLHRQRAAPLRAPCRRAQAGGTYVGLIAHVRGRQKSQGLPWKARRRTSITFWPCLRVVDLEPQQAPLLLANFRRQRLDQRRLEQLLAAQRFPAPTI
jgi:hypothetical protein